jgi:hypothetical protein
MRETPHHHIPARLSIFINRSGPLHLVHRCFSVDPTARVTDLVHGPSSYKSCFLFDLTPLDRRFRVVPLHLHPAPSGGTPIPTRYRVDQVIEEVTRADSRILLNFISVDGDEGYNEYFERGFN